MGIAGLARRLEPYATRHIPEELEGFCAVVDGPSLAYHAHKLALAITGSQSRLPSYADINDQAIRWLNRLEDININVSAILFDGALPSAKKGERISRLEQNNRRIRDLRNNYPSGACPIPTHLGSVSYSFLAPALKEALAETRFGPITRVVPGEADDWCVLYTNDNSHSIIFTSDTDLLLYEYPLESLVMFFKDVELLPEPKFKGYSPTKIHQQLNLKSLVPLAYSIVEGPSNTFNELVRDARGCDTDSEQYQEFSKRYAGREHIPAYIANNPDLHTALQSLDVRVSEIVHQTLDNPFIPTVYLPLLVEDANAASAWSIGQNLRRLAYSLLAPNRAAVQEYKRKAQGIAVQEIKLYSIQETHAEAKEIARDVSVWVPWADSRYVPSLLVWPLYALCTVLAELKLPPQVSILVRILNGDFDNTWEYIQLTARMQAALYSLRLFKQIISVWIAIAKDTSGELYEAILRLHHNLENFPTIADIFIVPGQRTYAHMDEEMLRDTIKQIYRSVNINVPDEHKSKSQRKKEKREKQKREQKMQPRSSQPPSNVFAVLGQE